MGIGIAIEALRRSLHRLRACENGNVAMMFGLAVIPLMGLVGAAVDYSRANAVKSAMQAAADATALFMSKDAATLPEDQLREKAAAYFKAMFNRPDTTEPVVTVTYTKGAGSQVVLSASTSLKTEFMGLFGYGIRSLDIGTRSEVKWGNDRLRVALVLDTTGSMSSAGKMTALQTATKDLLDQLKAAGTNPGDVYVSIVPFAKDVNIGKGYYTSPSIDWTDWEAEPQKAKDYRTANASAWERVGPGSSCPFSNNSHGFRCTEGPANGSKTTTEIPSTGAYSGYICPSIDSGSKIATKGSVYYNGCYTSVEKPSSAWYTVCTGSSCSSTCSLPNCSCTGSGKNRVCKQKTYDHPWRQAGTAAATPHSTWNGCVTDRGTSTGPNNDFDRNITAPSTNVTASLYPAEQFANCSPQAIGLNDDFATMKTMVEAFSPAGTTNQPIGLVWGWQTLVGGGPFTVPEKNPNFTYRQAIVLMSDGLNTLNRWNGNGSNANAEIDKRMYESDTVGTCANIKKTGITIYTVHVNTDGDPMWTLLKNCASSPDKFWMVTTAGGLGSVFKQIGSELSQLRIAQ